MQSNEDVGMHTSTEEMYVSPYMKFKRVCIKSDEFRASRNIKAAKSRWLLAQTKQKYVPEEINNIILAEKLLPFSSEVS